MDLEQLFGQAVHLAFEHGPFLGRAGTAAAQHEALGAVTVGVIDELGFNTILHVRPVFIIQKLGLEVTQLRLGCADYVECLAVAQELDITLADHATVHHPDALGLAKTVLHLRHYVLDRGDVGAVAGEHLVVERKALGRANQADADLLAVAARVAAVAPSRLVVAQRLAFKIGTRHIVKEELEGNTEPVAVALHEMFAKPVLMRPNLVQRAVQTVVIYLIDRDSA